MAVVKVKEDGKAPSGLSAGDSVVTGGGTYKITGVNSDGSYKSEKVSNETTSTYKGSYDAPGGGSGSSGSSGGGRNSSPTVSNGASALAAAASTMASRGSGGSSGGGYGNGQTVKVGSDGKAPPGLSVGTDVVTGGGTYRITGINSDGTYQSTKINNVTTGTYSGIYANAPYGGAQGLNLWAPGGINGSDGQGGFAAYGTGDFQDAAGNTYSHLFWDLMTDGTIRNNKTGEILSYYPGEDRTGKQSTFAGVTKAYGENGDMVIFSTPEEIEFLNNAPAGASKTMNGATYTKNQDGGVTIVTNGDRRVYKTALSDGSWTKTGGGGQSGSSGGGSSGGAVGAAAMGLAGVPTQQMPQMYGGQIQQASQGAMGQAAQQLLGQQGQAGTPSWQMPAYPDIPAFEYTPYEETAQGKQAQADYQSLLDGIKEYEPFSYDPNEDPMYQQYSEAYTRNGERAMQDVLGQVSARTGGLASSYAGAAAQQTYDQYMADLANKIPELRQLAYNMYKDDYNRQLGLYDRSYQRYADDFNRYMDATRLNQDSWSTKARLDANRWATEAQLNYDAYRAAIADRQWQQQFDWGVATDARDYNWNVLTNVRDYNRDVLTGDRDYSRQIDLDKYQQEQDQKQWDWQEKTYADQREDMLRQERREAMSDLWDQVNRYGRIPSLEAVIQVGGTEADYQQMVEQAKHVRAADASKYYGGVY